MQQCTMAHNLHIHGVTLLSNISVHALSVSLTPHREGGDREGGREGKREREKVADREMGKVRERGGI